jgi:hypothetical protein
MDKLKEALGRVSISSPSGEQYPDEDMKSQSRLSLTSVDSAVCNPKRKSAPKEEIQMKHKRLRNCDYHCTWQLAIYLLQNSLLCPADILFESTP